MRNDALARNVYAVDPQFEIQIAPPDWLDAIPKIDPLIAIRHEAKGLGSFTAQKRLKLPVLRNTPYGMNVQPLRWGVIDGLSKTNLYYRPSGKLYGYPALVPVSHVDIPPVQWHAKASGVESVRLRHPSDEWFYIGAVWRPADPSGPEGVTILVRPAGPLIGNYAEFQPVVIEPNQVKLWLSTSSPIWLQTHDSKVKMDVSPVG